MRFASGLEAGAIAELGGTLGQGVTVLEGFLGLGCAYLPNGAKVGPFIEVGPLLHLGSSDALSVTELDAALGAGVQMSIGYFLAQLAVYGRLRSFQDRDGSDVAHDTGHFGLIARIGGQLGQLSGP